MKYKQQILDNICYTELVYNRINKKLNLDFSHSEIEHLINELILESEEEDF